MPDDYNIAQISSRDLRDITARAKVILDWAVKACEDGRSHEYNPVFSSSNADTVAIALALIPTSSDEEIERYLEIQARRIQFKTEEGRWAVEQLQSSGELSPEQEEALLLRLVYFSVLKEGADLIVDLGATRAEAEAICVKIDALLEEKFNTFDIQAGDEANELKTMLDFPIL